MHGRTLDPETIMAASEEWRVPPEFQPDPDELDYDLDQALASVVSLRASVPAKAFTAETLGTERSGHGVVIRADGLAHHIPGPHGRGPCCCL